MKKAPLVFFGLAISLLTGCEQNHVQPKAEITSNSISQNEIKSNDEIETIESVSISSTVPSTIYEGDVLEYSLERCLCGGSYPDKYANIYLIDVINPCKSFKIASNVFVRGGFYFGSYTIPMNIPSSTYKVAADDLTYGGLRRYSSRSISIVTSLAYPAGDVCAPVDPH